MVRVPVEDPSWLEAALPLYDGFPYLTVRVVHVLRHVTVLPRDWTPEDLDALARRQTAANRLEACLVLSSRLALYYGPGGGSGSASPTPPYGGLLVTGRLQPPVAFPATGELKERAGRLRAYIKRTQSQERYVLGDPAKGGRPATSDELVRLEGHQPGGVPRGLTRCFVCQRWAGACLDPNPRFRGQLMRVHCRCDNERARPTDDSFLSLAELERRHILRVLDSTGGNLTAAAKRLGVNRGTLNRKMRAWDGGGVRPGSR